MPLQGEYEPSPVERERLQVALYEVTGGRAGNALDDAPVIILTTLGVKSGKIRKNPLMRVEANGSYAVVTSNGGATKHPTWYYNIAANPLVELQDGSVKRDMKAREVFGAEKEIWWERAEASYAPFTTYRAKAGRDIPIFVLEPVNE
ncbi:nitroreductase family deazaflavin-dependent oxidoreductase [Streptomyces mirabilis]|uniref:nitroreductase family deazaflavin-dependent oxidoreductase n=1 Tax=Streptomyces mirabilis TaxID=68239 RepID=UPI0033BF1267